MINAIYVGHDAVTAHGLTQYDYGQILQIDGLPIEDGTEIHFCQRGKTITKYIVSGQVEIPDYMLQFYNNINAYIYKTDAESGKTIKKITLNIYPREKPGDYVTPEEPEYFRLIPPGGSPGQVPVRENGSTYVTAWGYKADSLELVDGYVQLLSGTEKIGERIRINISEREIELANDGTSIKWRYTDRNDWSILADLESLKGPPGETPEFEIREGHLYAIYKN